MRFLGRTRIPARGGVDLRFNGQVGVTGDPPMGFGILRNLGKQKTAFLP